MKRIQILILIIWVVGYFGVKEYYDHITPRNTDEPRFVKTVVGSKDNVTPSTKFCWLDMQSINMLIAKYKGQPIKPSEITITTKPRDADTSIFILNGHITPRYGLTIIDKSEDTKNIYMYHELIHWALNTQSEPLKTTSLFFRRALSMWIIPVLMIFLLAPKLLETAKKNNQNKWAAYTNIALLSIMLLFIAFCFLDPEEIYVDITAQKMWESGEPMLVQHEYSNSIPMLDTSGNLHYYEPLYTNIHKVKAFTRSHSLISFVTKTIPSIPFYIEIYLGTQFAKRF